MTCELASKIQDIILDYNTLMNGQCCNPVADALTAEDGNVVLWDADLHCCDSDFQPENMCQKPLKHILDMLIPLISNSPGPIRNANWVCHDYDYGWRIDPNPKCTNCTNFISSYPTPSYPVACGVTRQYLDDFHQWLNGLVCCIVNPWNICACPSLYEWDADGGPNDPGCDNAGTWIAKPRPVQFTFSPYIPNVCGATPAPSSPENSSANKASLNGSPWLIATVGWGTAICGNNCAVFIKPVVDENGCFVEWQAAIVLGALWVNTPGGGPPQYHPYYCVSAESNAEGVVIDPTPILLWQANSTYWIPLSSEPCDPSGSVSGVLPLDTYYPGNSWDDIDVSVQVS